MSETNKGVWKKYKWGALTVFLLLIVLSIWIVYPVVLFSMIPTPTPDKTWAGNIGDIFGTYGDSFGALNTLFSGLAFFGVIISVIMQTQELKLTREEFKGQREEFEKQNEILENQRKITEQQEQILREQHDESQRQNLVNQFYALLEERRFRIESIRVFVSNPNGVYKEYKAISGINNLCINFRKSLQEEPLSKEGYKKMWNTVISKRSSVLVGYFEIYFLALDFVNNEFSDDMQLKFLQTIKKLITYDEYVFLLWLGIFDERLKNYIKQYSLLSVYFDERFIQIVLIFYSKEDFGDNQEWKRVFEAKKQTLLPPNS